jgi:hypothetical protein
LRRAHVRFFAATRRCGLQETSCPSKRPGGLVSVAEAVATASCDLVADFAPCTGCACRTSGTPSRSALLVSSGGASASIARIAALALELLDRQLHLRHHHAVPVALVRVASASSSSSAPSRKPGGSFRVIPADRSHGTRAVKPPRASDRLQSHAAGRMMSPRRLGEAPECPILGS